MKRIEDRERFTLSKLVSDNLRQYIIDHQLKTGDKLPSERDLASMLNVSRVIVREALRALESTGIIVIRHGEGAFVNSDDTSVILNHLLFFWKMSNERIEELFELRQLLEKTAIEQIIVNSDTKHLTILENIIFEMSETSDSSAFKELDIEFHKELIKATNNELFTQLTDVVVQYFSGVSHEMDELNRNKVVTEHQLIVDAIKDKNKNLALQLLNDHLQYSLVYPRIS
ncbi:FadR/GntR family transcriptional regulator [Lederbergia wuyishanensis]|uniref:DNA-binding FadR family transcriptional regulator n=1 Tax=Lederbergia wuyishanensis TaxID=1347903 RepID=A0ABU0D5Y8_9BACI|nr:FadR/GntR family transcriptional regulator [Lederbergia wuyishanensis]MCJ8008392.1 FadR family transcriptional regulator [Lederbergia wuyishanensis]MDQ0343809.1 DNA-binding FadR family transcriptional regulator [Lederbergia wuyishanensis]